MQHTLDQLKSLRLIGLLEAWQEQQAQPTYHDLAFDERLSLLVEREYLRRQQPRGLKKSQFLQWAQGQWLTQHLSLVVVGPTGVGKTFLACSLADHLCTQGYAVRYLKTADLLSELKLAKVDGSFPKLRKHLATFDLIVLDEWLRDALSPNQAREILDFLDDRYRRASCLFATQFPVDQWHPQIQDPTLADAILDRIVHDSLRLTLKGESMRKLTSSLTSPTDPHHETPAMT